MSSRRSSRTSSSRSPLQGSKGLLVVVPAEVDAGALELAGRRLVELDLLLVLSLDGVGDLVLELVEGAGEEGDLSILDLDDLVRHHDALQRVGDQHPLDRLEELALDVERLLLEGVQAPGLEGAPDFTALLGHPVELHRIARRAGCGEEEGEREEEAAGGGHGGLRSGEGPRCHRHAAGEACAGATRSGPWRGRAEARSCSPCPPRESMRRFSAAGRRRRFRGRARRGRPGARRWRRPSLRRPRAVRSRARRPRAVPRGPPRPP